MKKCYSNLMGVKLQLIAMLFTSGLFLAQKNLEQEKETVQDIMIAYKTPFSYSFNRDVSWELSNSTGDLINRGTGDFTESGFDVPGNYVLSVNEKHNHSEGSCEHDQYPSKLNITVSPVKMQFDLSTVKFSKDIKGGQSTKGITVTVNAHYSSANNEAVVYEYGFTTAGVGTSVVGKLKNDRVALKPGINTLTFLLDGIVKKGNYMMLDFKDINGQIQSYTLTQKIQ